MGHLAEAKLRKAGNYDRGDSEEGVSGEDLGGEEGASGEEVSAEDLDGEEGASGEEAFMVVSECLTIIPTIDMGITAMVSEGTRVAGATGDEDLGGGFGSEIILNRG
eukprot:Filipodium_phascolosomae@DN2550_c0_g1_i1.p3